MKLYTLWKGFLFDKETFYRKVNKIFVTMFYVFIGVAVFTSLELFVLFILPNPIGMPASIFGLGITFLPAAFFGISIMLGIWIPVRLRVFREVGKNLLEERFKEL